MRLTKKTVRDAKHSILRRTHELEKMKDSQLETEFHRIFPDIARTEGGKLRKEEVMMLLLRDWIDRSLPDHWLE